MSPVEVKTAFHFQRNGGGDGQTQRDPGRETKKVWRVFHVMLISVNPHSPLTGNLTSSDLDDPCCHGNWKNKHDTPLLSAPV